MNQIITIGREFGSGGRELGKRLSELLGCAYYDREIVRAIAQRSELAESYVDMVLENGVCAYYPITVANTFSAAYDPLSLMSGSLYAAQTEILRELAGKSDCVIVGRCADHVLADLHPLRIFVYASRESKLARCREKDQGEWVSDRELERRIRAVDRARSQYYRSCTGCVWGDKANYDLCINTSGMDLKPLAAAIAALAAAVRDCGRGTE